MYPVVEGSPEFHRLVAGRADADLARVAFEIDRAAATDVDEARAQERLDDLARRVRGRLGSSPERWVILEAMKHALFSEFGLHAADLERVGPRSCFLSDALTRRSGAPITLTLLYMAVAERVGLPVQGVALAGHFVLRAELDGEAVFVDPSRGGLLLDRRAALGTARRGVRSGEAVDLSPWSKRDLTTRLLQTLKALFIRERRFAEVIPVLKHLAVLNREAPEELRDLGIICFYEQRRPESLSYLLEYLKASPSAEDAAEIRFLLRAVGLNGPRARS